MNFLELLNTNTKNFKKIFERKYDIDVNQETLKKLLVKSKENKKKINELFSIDDAMGYTRIKTRINKKEMLEDFIKNNINHTFLLESCQKHIDKIYRNKKFIVKGYEIEKHSLKVKYDFEERNIDLNFILTKEQLKYFVKNYYYTDANDIPRDLIHLIVKDCQEDLDLYIITNNLAMIFSDDSRHFKNYQSFHKKYHSGNWFNLLSKNVFMVVALDKENNLMSRCCCYINNNNDIVIGRIYNNKNLNGRHILNMLSDLNLINIKDYRLKKVNIKHNIDIGYKDYLYRLFLASKEVNEISLEDVKIFCLKCNKEFYNFTPEIKPVCCDYEAPIGICKFCNQNVLENDDYILTETEDLFHSYCNGGWFYDDKQDKYFNK